MAARSREGFDQAVIGAQAAAAARDYRRALALLAPYLAAPAGPFAEPARREAEGVTRTATGHWAEAEGAARELLRGERFSEAAALAGPFTDCGIEVVASGAAGLLAAVREAEAAKRARIEQAVKGLFVRAEGLLNERDFAGAAAILREALDMGGAVVDPTLPLRVEQAAVLAEMKLAIIAAAGRGAFPSHRAGETVKTADAESLTITAGDMEVKLLWKAIRIDDLVALAGSAGKAGSGPILLTVARYHLAREEFDAALELLDEARRRNINLPEVLRLTAETTARRNAAFARIEEERRKAVEAEAAGLLARLAEAEKAGDTETMVRLYRECTDRYAGTEAVAARQALLDRVKEALGARAAAAETPPRKPVVLKARSEAEISAFRPRLIFDPVRLAELKKSPYRADVDSMIGQDRGNELIHYAFSYVVNGNKKNGQAAVAMALKIAAGEPDIAKDHLHPAAAGVAYAYDWCHDLLTEADRKTMIAWLNKLYGQYVKDGYDTPLHNYSFANIHTFTMAGYATLGENDNAPVMIKEARRRWEEIMMPGLLLAARGGAWPEGESYGQGVLARMMGFLETMYNTAGIDYYAPAEDFLLQRLAYNLFFIYPGPPPSPGGGLKWHHVFRGDGDVFKNTDNEMVTRLNLMRRYRDTDIGQYAAWLSAQPRLARANFGSGFVYDALFRDTSVPQKNPKDWKLTHFSPGGGIVLMKSSWKDDATHVMFDCGPLFCGHDHADQNSFMIYKNGFLTYDSGAYQGVTTPWAVDYYCRSIAHNTVTVYTPGAKMIARRQTAANDGGQLWREYEASTLAQVRDFKGGDYEAGYIIALDYTDLYTYAVGDATKAYAPDNVKEFKRHLLYLRPDTVIVFDKVTAAQEGARKRWHLHTTGQPTVSDDLVTATAQGGRLFCRTLLPDKPAITVIEGFEVDGKTLKPSGELPYPEWRIDVSPTVEEKTTLFAHVLYAGDATTQAMPPCGITDEGTTIEITAGPFKVRFAKSGAPGGLLMVGGRKVELASKINKEF
ncbi:MAG: heparinase II/III family protein [Planctomycetota bacterium]